MSGLGMRRAVVHPLLGLIASLALSSDGAAHETRSPHRTPASPSAEPPLGERELIRHGTIAEVARIPYFARRFGLRCGACHAAPPRLNEAGEAFVASGYERDQARPRRTWPLALWLSGRSESLGLPADRQKSLDAFLNRVEVISGGKFGDSWLSYFAEWRPVSREARSNGTLRRRDGRFEDLLLRATPGNLDITVGQFRQLGQVDVSQRVSLSEPLVLSASLPGVGGGTSRERSLRAFSPSGRSPAMRVGWATLSASGWRWLTSAALPVPGEFSIPLNDSSKVEASNEIEWRAKGVMLESFVRRGVTSLGAHLFYDDGDRYLANALATGRAGSFYWTGVTGIERRADATFGRWSAEAEYIPNVYFALGTRVEDRAHDGAKPAFLPYLSVQLPATTYIVRVTLERRFQSGRNATFLEFGTVF